MISELSLAEFNHSILSRELSIFFFLDQILKLLSSALSISTLTFQLFRLSLRISVSTSSEPKTLGLVFNFVPDTVQTSSTSILGLFIVHVMLIYFTK